MPAWKSLVSLLALAGSAASCAHHGDAEVVPEHEREELLKKWDQEVRSNSFLARRTHSNESSGPSPASPALPTSTPSSVSSSPLRTTTSP